MRKILKAVWSFLLALADRAAFYVACVRESDLLDGCIIVGCCATALVGGMFCAWLMIQFAKWMEGR